MDKAVENLLKSLKSTAGSRFNAAKRLSFVDRRLTALTAFTSTFIIALTIFPKFIEVTGAGRGWIELTTVGFSVLLLASSVLQYASNHATKSELFHRSALEINSLKRKLQLDKGNISKEDFQKISNEYEAVLQKFNLNHEDVDFYRYQLERKDDFPMPFFKRWYRLLQINLAYLYPSIFLCFIALVLLGVTYYALNGTSENPPASSTAKNVHMNFVLGVNQTVQGSLPPIR